MAEPERRATTARELQAAKVGGDLGVHRWGAPDGDSCRWELLGGGGVVGKLHAATAGDLRAVELRAARTAWLAFPFSPHAVGNNPTTV